MTTVPLSLDHLIRPPAISKDISPGIFLFHGYGSNEDDLFSFASELPDNLCIISVRAPFSLEPFGYAWYAINFEASYGKWSDIEQATESRDKILSFMDEAIEAYQLDPENISILGFSQGAVLSYAIALSYPERIRNLIALSGYIDERLLVEGYENKEHKGLNVYVSHGQLDQVIPPEWALNAKPIMDNLNIEFTFEEYLVGHGVSPQNFYSFRDWLKKHL